MTAPDTEALVAYWKEQAVGVRKMGSPNQSNRFMDTAIALERQQAVVVAARVVCSNPLDVLLVGALCKALAAHDAPPEGEPHPYSPDYQAMGDCLTCGRLERDPIHTPPEGEQTHPPFRSRELTEDERHDMIYGGRRMVRCGTAFKSKKDAPPEGDRP